MSVLVQREAPPFTAAAIMPDDEVDESFSLEKYRGRYVALSFYPLDFTFVCPSEILAFDHRLDEFRKRDCEVIGVSVDSQFTHLAWKKTSVEDGGTGTIRFPLVADLSKQIARDYGILSDGSVALRGTFLIDREGVVRHQVVNDLNLGRNIDDVLRTLDALQHTEKSGHVCPANWEKGKDALEPTSIGVKKYLKDFGLEL
jgi:peroxiredoxin (alkyl hydroperoxide reductase subunit C)